MTSGKVSSLLIGFTIPLVLGNLLQLTYNAADSIIVGRLSVLMRLPLLALPTQS